MAINAMKQINFCLTLLILAIPLILFNHTLPYGFIDLDDRALILENSLIKFFSWPNLYEIFSRFHFGQYKPLTLLSLAVDYSAWNAIPYGFRLTSLVLHALNTALLYLLLRKMKVGIFSSFFASILFACHPVQIEAFIWIAARKHVLSTFFLFASFLSHITFRESNKRRDQTVSAACFALALLTDSLSAMFPLIIIAYDYFYLKRASLIKLIRENFVYLLVAFVMGIVFIQASRSEGYFGHYFTPQNWKSTWVNIPILIWRYIFLAFSPINQSFMYDSVGIKISWKYWIAVIALIAIIFQVFRKRNSRSELTFWMIWVFIFLAPTLFLPLHSVFHDRYLYLPLIGLVMIVRIPLIKLMGLWGESYFRKTIVLLLILLILTMYIKIAWKRSFIWRDNFTLISDTLKKAPRHYFSHYGMALEWIRQEKYDPALKELDEALKAPIAPGSYDTTYNTIAQIYFIQKKYDKGIEALKKAISFVEKDVYYINLGVFYRRTGQLDQAMQAYLKAIKLGTKEAAVYNNMGVIYEHQGDFKKAAEAYQTALKLNPNYAEALQNLATLMKNKQP